MKKRVVLSVIASFLGTGCIISPLSAMDDKFNIPVYRDDLKDHYSGISQSQYPEHDIPVYVKNQKIGFLNEYDGYFRPSPECCFIPIQEEGNSGKFSLIRDCNNQNILLERVSYTNSLKDYYRGISQMEDMAYYNFVTRIYKTESNLVTEVAFLDYLTNILKDSVSNGEIEDLSSKIMQFVGESMLGKAAFFQMATQKHVARAIGMVEKLRMNPGLRFTEDYLPTSKSFSQNHQIRNHQESIYILANTAHFYYHKSKDLGTIVQSVRQLASNEKMDFYSNSENIYSLLKNYDFINELNNLQVAGASQLFSGDSMKAAIASPAFYSVPTNQHNIIESPDRICVFSDTQHFYQKQKWALFLSQQKRPPYVNIDPLKVEYIVPVLQHSASFINKNQFPNTILATQNVIYCVNVTVHNPEDKTSGMAHLDINTNIESLSLLLENVRNNKSKNKMIISIISSYMSDRLYEIFTYIEKAGYAVQYVDTSYAGISNADTSYMQKGANKFVFYYPYSYYKDAQNGEGIFSKNFMGQRNLAMTAGKGTLLNLPSQSHWHQKLETFENTLSHAYKISMVGTVLDRTLLNKHIQNFREYRELNQCFPAGTWRYEIENLNEIYQEFTPICFKRTNRNNRIFYNINSSKNFPFSSSDLMYAFNLCQGDQ